ncbi:MAG: hypothetical protein ACOVMR_04710 [Flavobacteriales bacterium]|jgi:hypothetical protein
MKKFILFIVVVLVVVGCRDRQSQIPVVSVNFSININEPQFFDLSVPTGYVYVIGGSQGIIVYRINETDFIALERHSPVNPENDCQVIVAEDGVIIEDPCSNARWLINDGSVVDGDNSFALRTYETSFNNPILYIFN